FWDYVFNPPWDYYYARESRLPKASELRAVSGYDGTYNPVGKGASLAAGWPVASYWTGEVTAHPGDAGHGARLVNLGNGYADNAVDLVFSYPVVCRP
ncbi:MAG: hypothetical protein LBP33_01185, partial [Candidatus Adiutrix sp.]|nr:hypothetical protein [Candidatus Adiutrix sp.]